MIQKNNQNTIAEFSCAQVEIDLLHDNFEEVYVVVEHALGGVPSTTRHIDRSEAAARFRARVSHWLKSAY